MFGVGMHSRAPLLIFSRFVLTIPAFMIRTRIQM